MISVPKGSDPQRVQTSILQTLSYSDHFGFPLTAEEIHLRLFSSEPCSLERVFGTLESLLKQKKIQKTSTYYHLPGRHSLLSLRHSRAQTSAPQLARAQLLASRLGSFPGVLAVYLTGSLAMSNSSPDSDIDFMLITDNSRLWTVRLLLTLYTELLGLRRHPHDPHTSGKLCLNLYLTPKSYSLPPIKRSLYTAYELIQAVPLYDPLDTRSALLATNSWLKKYLPNFPLPAARRSDLVGCKPNQKPTRSDLVGIFEKIAYHLQLLYMRPKLTREYITPDSAFFHPHDPGASVLKKVRTAKEMLSLPKHV